MTFQNLMDCCRISDQDNNRLAYEELLKQIRKQNVIPFIGAGLSSWAYPLWTPMLKQQAKNYGLEQEIGQLLADNQYEKAASALEAELTHNGLTRLLQEIFRTSLLQEKAGQHPEHQLKLLQLFQGPIITTNFDRAIEYLFDRAGRPRPDTVIPSDDFQSDKIRRALHNHAPVLLKMHGDIMDPEHLVLTTETYNDTYGPDPAHPNLTRPMPGFLQKLLEHNPLLFLGCSLEADRTCAVVRACAPSHRHFAFLPLPRETVNSADPLHPILQDANGKRLPALRQRWNRLMGELNIRPIWYPWNMHDEALCAFLTQLTQDAGIKPPPVSTPNPDFAPLHKLLGRNALVRDVALALEEPEARCVWVDGPAGIGKTETCKAVYAALRDRHPALNVSFLDVAGVTGLPAFYDTVARGTGIAVPTDVSAEAMPEYLLERLDQLWPLQPPPARLLYFDNWEDAWYALGPEDRNRLVQWIRKLCARQFRLLISSRELPPPTLDHRRFRVEPLDRDALQKADLPEDAFEALDSVRLFCSILGRAVAPAEQNAFRSLIRKLEGHPLSIVLTATQARRELNLSSLLDRWNRARQDTAGIHPAHASLDVALQVSWNAVCGNQEAVIQWGLEFYSLKAIPDAVFQGLRGDTGEEAWAEGLRTLMGANLVYPTQSRDAVAMLLPLKKQFEHFALPDDPIRETCLLRWAQYIENLLQAANQLGTDGYLPAHRTTLNLLPQIFHILEQLMLHCSAQTSLHLNRIVRRVHNYYQFHPLSGNILKQLLLYYQHSNAPGILAETHADYGNFLWMIGDVDGALEAYDAAEPLFKQVQNNLGLANLLRARGDLLCRLGDLDGAKTSYDDAEPLFRLVGSKLGLANLLRARGNLLCCLDDLDGAKAAYDDAEPLFKQVQDNLGLANLLRVRGDLLCYLGNLDGAKASYDAAEPLFKQERDKLGLANLLMSRGNLLYHLDDLDGAETSYDDAEPLFRQVQDKLGLANLLRARGDLLCYLDDLDGAKAAYDDAEPLFRQVQDKLGLANLLRARGDLLCYLGNLDGAKASYDAAEPLFKQEQNNLGLANLMRSHGDLLKQSGQVEEAYLLYKKAETLYLKLQEPMGHAYTLAELYECCRRLQNHPEAEARKAQLLDIAKDIPYERVRQYIYQKLRDF